MRRRLVSALIVVAGAVRLPAQSATGPSAAQRAAFAAIILTPAGALPVVVRVRRTADSAARADVSFRYGRYSIANSPDSRNNIGLSGMLNISRRLQAGATLGYRQCACESSRMASVDFGASLWRKEAAGDVGGDTDVGFLASAGIGKADTSDVTAWSAVFGVPFAISLPQTENTLLTVFVAPEIGYGIRKLNGVAEGAPLFIIAAGLGYTFEFGLGVHATMHRVIIADSPTQVGFAASWRFGRK